MSIVIGIVHSPEAQPFMPQQPSRSEQIQEQIAEIRAEAAQVRAEAQATARAAMQEHPPQPVIVQTPPFPDNDIPVRTQETVLALGGMATAVIIVLLFSRMVARWIDRRKGGMTVAPDLSAQLTRMETAIEAMQIEVERISEAQRFMARLVSEQREAVPIGAGAGAGKDATRASR